VVEDKFEFIKQIGHGAYGVVCSALDKKKNVKIAIKKVLMVEGSRWATPSRT
jgi:mitogen-activated protein kinase 1/3